MELLSINGHSVNDLLKMILPNLPGDGFIETGKRRRLGRSFGQNYWLFVDQSSEFVISAKDVKGKIVTTKLQGVLNIERENNRNNNPVNAKMLAILPQIETAKKNISLHFIDGFEIAKLRILYFDGASFNATLDTVFQSLHDHKTKSLILDLRGNPGGVDTYGAWLVAHFTNQPFRYFDRIHITTVLPSFSTWKPGTSENLRNGVIPDSIRGGFLVTTKLHEGVGLQNPASQPFLGKVIVLMDGGTFSTATDVTAILSQLTTATFVGEESGGTYEGNTSGLNALIKLPNSKLGLKINMYGYWNAVSGGQKGRGTMPDHPVVLRTNDLLEGFDLQWDKALSLAKQNSIKK
jgi:C-terminal processing protease CtpA/Prc